MNDNKTMQQITPVLSLTKPKIIKNDFQLKKTEINQINNKKMTHLDEKPKLIKLKQKSNCLINY